jgi:hypothetical protein
MIFFGARKGRGSSLWAPSTSSTIEVQYHCSRLVASTRDSSARFRSFAAIAIASGCGSRDREKLRTGVFHQAHTCTTSCVLLSSRAESRVIFTAASKALNLLGLWRTGSRSLLSCLSYRKIIMCPSLWSLSLYVSLDSCVA